MVGIFLKMQSDIVVFYQRLWYSGGCLLGIIIAHLGRRAGCLPIPRLVRDRYKPSLKREYR
jgi:hypothetical protein